MSRLDHVLDAVYRKDFASLARLTTEDVRLVDEDGRTPLMHAVLAEDADPAVVRSLLERGSDVNAVEGGEKWTSLHFAARDQKAGIVRALLDAGATVDAVDAFGDTPLWRAMMNSSPDPALITDLVRHGADPRRKNNHGIAPVDFARDLGRADLFAALGEKA